MKIVDFSEFIKLPAGTIFSYYEPNVFVGLYRKENSIKGDWNDEDEQAGIDYFQQLLLPHYVGEEIVVGGLKERWGEFSWDQEYAVYEAEDLAALKSMIG